MPYVRIAFWSLIACLIAPVVHSEIYKWTDENGRIHYGDRPENTGSETIEVKPAPLPDKGTEEHKEKQRKLLELIDEEREENKQKQAESKKEKQQRQINCEKSRKYHESLKTASGLYQEKEDRSKIILTHEERAAAETRAREDIEHWCN